MADIALLQTKLWAIQVDLETLIATNHNGRNDKEIRILTRVRKDLEETIGVVPPKPPILLELGYYNQVVKAIVEHDEAHPTMVRWLIKHPGGGTIMQVIRRGEV